MGAGPSKEWKTDETFQTFHLIHPASSSSSAHNVNVNVNAKTEWDVVTQDGSTTSSVERQGTTVVYTVRGLSSSEEDERPPRTTKNAFEIGRILFHEDDSILTRHRNNHNHNHTTESILRVVPSSSSSSSSTSQHHDHDHRPFWMVYRYDRPCFPGQRPAGTVLPSSTTNGAVTAQSQDEDLLHPLNDNEEEEDSFYDSLDMDGWNEPRPYFKVACITMGLSGTSAVVAFFSEPTVDYFMKLDLPNETDDNDEDDEDEDDDVDLDTSARRRFLSISSGDSDFSLFSHDDSVVIDKEENVEEMTTTTTTTTQSLSSPQVRTRLSKRRRLLYETAMQGIIDVGDPSPSSPASLPSLSKSPTPALLLRIQEVQDNALTNNKTYQSFVISKEHAKRLYHSEMGHEEKQLEVPVPLADPSTFIHDLNPMLLAIGVRHEHKQQPQQQLETSNHGPSITNQGDFEAALANIVLQKKQQANSLWDSVRSTWGANVSPPSSHNKPALLVTTTTTNSLVDSNRSERNAVLPPLPPTPIMIQAPILPLPTRPIQNHQGHDFHAALADLAGHPHIHTKTIGRKVKGLEESHRSTGTDDRSGRDIPSKVFSSPTHDNVDDDDDDYSFAPTSPIRIIDESTRSNLVDVSTRSNLVDVSTRSNLVDASTRSTFSTRSVTSQREFEAALADIVDQKLHRGMNPARPAEAVVGSIWNHVSSTFRPNPRRRPGPPSCNEGSDTKPSAAATENTPPNQQQQQEQDLCATFVTPTTQKMTHDPTPPPPSSSSSPIVTQHDFEAALADIVAKKKMTQRTTTAAGGPVVAAMEAVWSTVTSSLSLPTPGKSAASTLLFSSSSSKLPALTRMTKDASDGSSSSGYGSYCTALSDEDDDDDDSSCSTSTDDDEPLVGSWSWDPSLTDSERKMELQLVEGADLALHVVLAVVMNQG